MLPKTTIVRKKIPKQRFYDNAELTPTLRRKFIDQIDEIIFANKFSKDTINIPGTPDVEEIFLFDLSLKDNSYINNIESVLTVIDKAIPYPILYRFKFTNFVEYKIAYKKRNQNDINKSIVDTYFTRKVPKSELDSFNAEFDRVFNALNMKVLYENLLKLFLLGKEGTTEELIEKEKERICTEKEIERLEKLLKTEKQADKQYELHKKIKDLNKLITVEAK